MGNYVASIWRCRYFWLSLVKMDLRTRYRRSVLGLGWSLLHPIAMTILMCLMFGRILKFNMREYGPYLFAGLACWNYLLYVSLQGCQCFFQGESYIRQFPAPLAIYPLRTALGASVHFVIALGVAIGVMWTLNGIGPIAPLFSLIPTFLLLLLLGWSCAVLAGFANVYFQDTQHLSEVGFQLLFYATPIIYPLETLQQNQLAWLLQCNPVVAFLGLIREPILHGHAPSLSMYAVASLIVAMAVGTAAYVLVRLQRTLIFYL